WGQISPRSWLPRTVRWGGDCVGAYACSPNSPSAGEIGYLAALHEPNRLALRPCVIGYSTQYGEMTMKKIMTSLLIGVALSTVCRVAAIASELSESMVLENRG